MALASNELGRTRAAWCFELWCSKRDAHTVEAVEDVGGDGRRRRLGTAAAATAQGGRCRVGEVGARLGGAILAVLARQG